MKQTLEAGAVMWVKKHVIPLHANYRNMRPVTQREINCLLDGNNQSVTFQKDQEDNNQRSWCKSIQEILKEIYGTEFISMRLCK